MNRLHHYSAATVAFCLLFSLLGCGGGSGPLLPPPQDSSTGPGVGDQGFELQIGALDLTDPSRSNAGSFGIPQGRMLFGIWDIGIDPVSREITIAPNRALEAHWDVTAAVSPPKCNDCLGIKVTNVDHVTHVISLWVTLKNPTKMLTGYDVRGTLLFPPGDNRELVNADDYTEIFDDSDPPDRNPFKAFAKDQPGRAFGVGAVHGQQYDIRFPPPVNLNVIYVVDASWPENQEEVYSIENVYLEGEFNECNSGEGWLYADAFDWQFNVTGMTLDLTPLGGEIVDMEHVINQTYRYYLNNEWGVPAGEYKLWLAAYSEDTDYALFDIFRLQVEECANWPPVWDDTIGVVSVVPIENGLEVVYGNATDQDVPVTYNIYWSENEPIEWTTASIVSDPDGSPGVVDGLSDANVYWVGVRAMDALGAEEKNTIQMSGVPSNPPVWDTTIGITDAIALDHSVEVHYGTAHDPQSPVTYNVYWSETTPIDFGAASVVNDDVSPTLIEDLDNFKPYYFAVRAMDAVGSEDKNTNERTAIPNGPPEWLGPIGIQSTIPGNESVTVTYGLATDIDLPVHYRVYYSLITPIDFGGAPYEDDLDGSPYTVTGLPNGVTHHFAVRAVDSGGAEEQNTVELPGTPNAAPTWVDDKVGVQDLIPFDHQVTVFYGQAVDPDLPITYHIYYSKTTPIDFGAAFHETTQDESPYVVTGLDNYVPYFFAVRAEDGVGIMEQNTNELFTIPNPAPIWDTTIGIQALESQHESLIAYYGMASDLDMPVSYRVYYSEDTPIDFGSALYVDDPGGSPTVIPGLVNGKTYYVAVRARDVYGHEEQNTVTLSGVPYGLPNLKWSVFTGGVVQASPALADLNGDTILDVVVGDQANNMVAYSGVDGSEIWSFPTGSWVDSSPALADQGGDATLDVIFGSLDKKVYCVNGATGGEIWHADVGGGVISSPTLANIKGDFHLDVIVGSLDGNVYAFNGINGAGLWTFPTGAGVFSSPATADLSGDEIPDFVVGSRDGNVYAINGATGLEIWSFPIGEWVNSSPALTELTGDDVPDAVIAGMDGDVYAINGETGLEIWSFPTGSYVWTSPSIAHLNTDGVPDVVLGADSSNVYAIDGASGTEIWRFPSDDRIWSSAALAELTGDTWPDAVVGSDDGKLYGIDGSDGSLIFAYPTGDWIDSSPAVGDVDGDEIVDIAFGRYDGYLTLLSTEGSAVGAMPWPMFRRDLAHTAMF